MRRESLLHYYERELAYVRRESNAFAEKYPEVAERLLLEATKSRDPHVERLIESFSLIAARVHQRLEDDFSEVSDALLEILYPHFLRPIPSMTICQLEVGPEKDCPASGVHIPRGATFESRPVDSVRCTFRNAYETHAFPLEVESVDLVPQMEANLPQNVRSLLKIKIRASGNVPISSLRIPSLRFFLNDQGYSLEQLYNVFFTQATGLMVRFGQSAPLVLGADAIRPVGFDPDEGLLEYPSESFIGYRILQEFFAFPDKFLFVDFRGVAEAPRTEDDDFLELSIMLPTPANALDLRVAPEHLLPNCTAAVNLFEHAADPIRIDETRSEFTIVPDARAPGSYEVYAITEVEGHSAGTDRVTRYNPLYALRHGSTSEDRFWISQRRETIRKNAVGTDVSLRITQADLMNADLKDDLLRVKLLCTNRDVPARIPFGDRRGDLSIRGVGEISKITCLRKPTPPIPAPVGPQTRWRLVSHLALNHLSLTGNDGTTSEKSLDAFREILRIYDYRDSPTTRQRIAGLARFSTRPCLRRLPGRGFGRGIEVELEFDRDQYTGMGVLPFAAVLERFLGLYASVNSFVQVVAKIQNQDEVLKRWPPRAGSTQLI